jgi:hypothetical protein
MAGNQNRSLSGSWQDDDVRIVWLLILPEDRDDSQRLLLLNQAVQVVAENLAQDFVPHGRVGLAQN